MDFPLPPYDIPVRTADNSKSAFSAPKTNLEIFDVFRRRWVRLTAEEKVRQQILHHLTATGYPQGRIEKVTLGVPVLINVENAVAAMAAAHLQGASDEALRKGVEGFQGTKRRFDVHLKNDRYVLIDDYAHHPNEIAASIASIRALYPGKRICGIFQPHLYSRTKAFAKEFGTSLSALDEVLLLDIYPAREKPMKGVTSNLILKNIKLNHKELCTKNTLLEHLATARFDILLTLGAGDIDQMIPEIKKALEQR